MAGFLYFVPGWDKSCPENPQQLPAVTGLTAVLEDVTTFEGRQSAGPEGFGCLFCAAPGVPKVELNGHKGESPLCAYEPEKQRWYPAPHKDGKPTHWIGYEKARPPRPVDLIRNRLCDGYMVELFDAQQWLIPECHPLQNTLPQSWMIDKDGNGSWAMLPRFDDIGSIAERWASLLLSEKASTMSADDFAVALPKLLTINYRVGPLECSGACLGVTTKDWVSIYGVVKAITGWPSVRAEIEAREKKVIVSAGSDGSQESGESVIQN